MNKKSLIVTLGVIVLVVLLAGGYFLFANKSKTQSTDDQTADQGTIGTLSPQDIGLKMTASPDKKKVKFTLAKASDIKSVDYQLGYEADSDSSSGDEEGDGSGRVSRGVEGQVAVNGKSSYESAWIDLGSCSKNVCRYDKNVGNLDLTLKVTKNNGRVYQSELKQENL